MDYYSDYDSMFGGIMAFGIGIIILVLAIAIVEIIATWRLYKKAGKGGWECIIPFYSNWVLVEIAGLEWWWFALMCSTSIVTVIGITELSGIATLANLFATFCCYYNIAKKFNKDTGTAVCAGLFSGIFVLIFGFSKKEVYNANIPVSKYGVFGKPEATNSYSSTNNYSTTNMNNYASTGNVDMNQNTVYCSNCGSKMSNDVRFCPNCGKERL